MLITAGMPAPDFQGIDDAGAVRRLMDYRGEDFVLYFYPADDTSGCTKEACHFRDDFSEYQKAGVSILGVSPDPVKSHAKFKTKYQLPFPLLADEDHKICEAYGVWGPKKLMGREYEGVIRTTFLINKQGVIAHVFENVLPSEHSAEVLETIKTMIEKPIGKRSLK